MQNAEIIKKFGLIKDDSFTMKNMSMKYNGPIGEAYLEIRIKGTNDKGIAVIDYVKIDNCWYIKKINLKMGRNEYVIVDKLIKSENIE